jgi:von Hippel-Lindau disease tumor supressor
MAGASESREGAVEVRKSKKSVVCSFVRFRNRTQRGVDIIWLNYEGARVKYKTLYAYEFVDVNTYVGHPWIFLDVETGERLVVDLKSVYEPTTGWVPGQWPPMRKVVNITIPSMFYLKVSFSNKIKFLCSHFNICLQICCPPIHLVS